MSCAGLGRTPTTCARLPPGSVVAWAIFKSLSGPSKKCTPVPGSTLSSGRERHQLERRSEARRESLQASLLDAPLLSDEFARAAAELSDGRACLSQRVQDGLRERLSGWILGLADVEDIGGVDLESPSFSRLFTLINSADELQR